MGKDLGREAIAIIILILVLGALGFCLYNGIIEYTKNF